MKLMSLIITLMMVGNSSFACVTNSVALNDAAHLTALGLYDAIEKQITIDLEAIENRVKKTGSAIINATDSKNQVTHKVIYLGSLKEVVNENGSEKTEVIQTSFLVKDLSSGAEQTIILKTNYLGNGVRARASATGNREPKRDQEFKTLLRTVCQ
jgi:hypothetical protein